MKVCWVDMVWERTRGRTVRSRKGVGNLTQRLFGDKALAAWGYNYLLVSNNRLKTGIAIETMVLFPAIYREFVAHKSRLVASLYSHECTVVNYNTCLKLYFQCHVL